MALQRHHLPRFQLTCASDSARAASPRASCSWRSSSSCAPRAAASADRSSDVSSGPSLEPAVLRCTFSKAWCSCSTRCSEEPGTPFVEGGGLSASPQQLQLLTCCSLLFSLLRSPTNAWSVALTGCCCCGGHATGAGCSAMAALGAPAQECAPGALRGRRGGCVAGVSTCNCASPRRAWAMRAAALEMLRSPRSPSCAAPASSAAVGTTADR